MGAMTGVELVRVADIGGCALCGIPSKVHGDRFGLGHLGDDRKTFVAPSEALRRVRVAYRTEAATSLPLGAVGTHGEPITHLVQAKCRCGALTMATPEQAPTARCSACLHADINEKGTSRA